MIPPAYPTDVEITPGSRQKIRSAPQKQPIPKTATCAPSGHGPFSGVPSTVCRGATGISTSRPGSASSAVTRSSFFNRRRNNVALLSAPDRSIPPRTLFRPYKPQTAPPADPTITRKTLEYLQSFQHFAHDRAAGAARGASGVRGRGGRSGCGSRGLRPPRRRGTWCGARRSRAGRLCDAAVRRGCAGAARSG